MKYKVIKMRPKTIGILITFFITFSLSFSNIETQIEGEFKTQNNLLKITKINEKEHLFILDYTIYEKPMFYIDRPKQFGRITIEVVLINVFQPTKDIKRPFPYDYRYFFKVKKILFSDNHPNLKVSIDKEIYINFYTSLNKIELIDLGSYLNSKLTKEVK